MYGGKGEEDDERKRRRRHMWPVPALGITVAGLDSTTYVTSNSFCKDGRKISVGDCALFKPQQETSPPFVGIIRWLSSERDSYLKLGVNWLYRPADVKLSKGVWLEAAPNEIFYSFHKDEIPAASLLHPCKVAFLRKGVELPPGISSFVCRRVYDPSNKRLWWLTDQDYLNERQEEVDQLLHKTRQEMHATSQSEGRSPKSLNGPTSTPIPQLKSGSDSAQNSPTSFPSQAKGKKRDRTDQGSESFKRERSAKTDDGASGYFRSDSMLKSDIAKITDKGALIDCEGVEKLIQLMQPDRVEKKIDLAGRILLADVITVTDKYDCLGKFVQLRGLTVLDEWLQEVHKGKIGDGGITKESEKPIEEFLLALLRALDKLPVDLQALQTSNIGKSVNHLRTHKNLEIQKKARGLVDMWKKRVEAEMNMNDAKSGSSQAASWSNKPGFPEIPQGSRRPVGSSDLSVKNSIGQPSGRPVVKVGQGESAVKLAPTSPGSMKLTSSPASMAVSKESSGKVGVGSGVSDIPLTTMKEEKSSSSSQSQNNSHSCSSDHTKLLSSWKEDARSSTAGSMHVNKTSSGAARHRKQSNGVVALTGSAAGKDTSLVKCSSMDRKVVPERVPHGFSSEKADVSSVDHGNNQRLVVKIPNAGRSPARSASGGSFDDHSVTVSRVCSPGFVDKHDQFERKVKVKSETYQTNISADVTVESCQGNDVKGGLGGSESNGSAAVPLDDVHGRMNNEVGKALDTSKSIFTSTGNHTGDLSSEDKIGKSLEASHRSMNVLIESCAKYSEANSSMQIGNDGGMDLLASVAAGEISKSELVPSIGSPRSSPIREDPSTHSLEEFAVRTEARLCEAASDDTLKQVSVVCPMQSKEGEEHVVKTAISKFSEDSSTTSSFSEKKLTEEHREQNTVSRMDLRQSADSCMRSDDKPDETVITSLVMSSAGKSEQGAEAEGAKQLHDSRMTSDACRQGDDIQDGKQKANSFSVNGDANITEDRVTTASDLVLSSVGDVCDIDNAVSGGKDEKGTLEKASSCQPLDKEREKKNVVQEESGASIPTEHKLPPVMNCNDAIKEIDVDASNANSMGGVKENGGLDASSHLRQDENKNVDWKSLAPSSLDDRVAAAVSSIVLDHDNGEQEISERKAGLDGSVGAEDSPATRTEGNAKSLNSPGSKLPGVDEDKLEDCGSALTVSVVAEPDMGGKLDFDLNEGFPAEEGNQSDTVSVMAPGSSSLVLPRGPLSFPLSSMSNGLPASITVAAAAKGPFVSSEHLLRPTGEIGWKGSAATSAFRPAEPRKILEMPLCVTDKTHDTSASKHGRPPLDIDLNAPGDRALEDMALQSSAQMTGSGTVISNRGFASNDVYGSSARIRCVGGLDLDLNKVEEETDTGQCSLTNSRRLEVLSVRPSTSGGYSNNEVNVLRNFDLNNGPAIDELSTEPAPLRQHGKNSVPFLPPIAGIRMNNTELGSLSSWFPPGHSYSALAIPPLLADRGEQPYPVVSTAGTQRLLAPTGAISFGTDVYRGPVLSSSPAVAFTPATAFPYPGFPFGTGFPSAAFSNGSTTYMDSSSGGGLCFPTVPSQLVGAASAVSSNYPRPYMINLPDGTINGGADSSRKWARQGLDLNAGPGGTDIEGRDERLLPISRQLPVASSQALAEEQVRMYQASSVKLKRSEPEGGWDAERYNYKQPSWQ